jgi:hypothetical protein
MFAWRFGPSAFANRAPEEPMPEQEPLKVFEPENLEEAVQGWALHATRRRKIHEVEARHLDRLRYYLGTFSACLAAVAGTSAFAAWESNRESVAAGVVTAAVGIGAAILGSVLTFLDLGGRAEAHRRAATAYKNVLREFEEASGSRKEGQRALDLEAAQKLKTLLADADVTAPVVPVRRGEKVEREPFRFVRTADALTPNAGRHAKPVRSGSPEAD